MSISITNLDKKSAVKWKCRPGSQDAAIISEVYYQNCYRLSGDLSRTCAVDVGAHIGSFAVAAAERGAIVWAFELDRENSDLASYHLSQVNSGVASVVLNAAVVGSANKSGHIGYKSEYHKWQGFSMTGGKGIFDSGARRSPAIRINSVVDLALTSSRNILLKLDCEGSEHQILASDLPWDKINHIVGECHDGVSDPLAVYGNTLPDLVRRLESVGYKVETQSLSSTLHLFFAERVR